MPTWNPHVGMIQISNVVCEGEVGTFSASEESIGWQRSDKASWVIPVGDVLKAAWLEGELCCLYEVGDGALDTIKVGGFSNKDYDVLWRHFEAHCGVYIKKHRRTAAFSAEDFDEKMYGLEATADAVDESAPGSVAKR